MKLYSELAEYSSASAQGVTGVLGFSSRYPGEILIEDLPVGRSLYVFRETFLVCSRNIKIQEADFPLVGDTFMLAVQSPNFTHNSLFHLTSPPAPATATATAASAGAEPRLVFLQAGARIMEKRLAVGESFIVNVMSLVGFDDQVAITLLEVGVFSNMVMGEKGAQKGCIRIEGPGVIFLSTCLLDKGSFEKKGSNNARGERDTRNYLVPLMRAAFTITSVMLILSIVARFITLGFELQELEQVVAAAGGAGGVEGGN
jgi:hypothetical protein